MRLLKRKAETNIKILIILGFESFTVYPNILLVLNYLCNKYMNKLNICLLKSHVIWLNLLDMQIIYCIAI